MSEHPAETVAVTLARIEEKLDRILDTDSQVRSLVTQVAPHIEKVGPLVDQLAASPLLKMLGGKKK